jgi:hypothetical protein
MTPKAVEQQMQSIAEVEGEREAAEQTLLKKVKRE